MNSLTAAFEECRVLNAHYGTRFYSAIEQLPNHLQPHIHGLCAFDRILIEMIQNPKTGVTNQQQIDAMKKWQTTFELGMSDEIISNPFLLASIHTAKIHDIDPNLYSELVKARIKQCKQGSSQLTSQRDKQMKLLAKVIASLLAANLKITKKKDLLSITRIALAGEIIQALCAIPEDVKRGRLFFTQAELKKGRIALKTLQSKKVTSNTKKLIEQYLKQCEQLLQQSQSLCSGSHQQFFSTIIEQYNELINTIREENYNVFGLQKTSFSQWKKKLAQSVKQLPSLKALKLRS